MIEYHCKGDWSPDQRHITQAIYDTNTSCEDVLVTWLAGGQAALFLSNETLLKLRKLMDNHRSSDTLVKGNLFDLIFNEKEN